jgi:hypothetical protein
MARKLKFIVAAALLAVSATAANATTVISLSALTTANQFLNLDLGINFSAASSFRVDSLGAFTNGTSPIAVRLYAITTPPPGTMNSTGMLLASASVTSAPAPGQNYAFTAIAPIVLGAGLYQITASYSDPGNGNYNPNSGPGPAVLFNTLGGVLAFSADGYNFPGSGGVATTIDGVSQLSYGAGTFTATAVPEPAMWAMMVLGFGLVGMARRRAPAVVAA